MNAESAKVPFPVGRFALFLLHRAFPWPILNPAWKAAPRRLAKYLALASAFAMILLGALMAILGVYLGAMVAWKFLRDDLEVSDLAGMAYFAVALLLLLSLFGLASVLGFLFAKAGWQFMALPSVENARLLAQVLATALLIGGPFAFVAKRLELAISLWKNEPLDSPSPFASLLSLVFAYLAYRLLRNCFSGLVAGMSAEASASK